MAIVKVPHLGRTLIMPAEIQTFLSEIGVEYQRWTRVHPIPAMSPAEEILKVYEPELQACQQKNNFAGRDVIELAPRAKSAEKIRNDLNREHWHRDFETYFILDGQGICYVHPAGQPVVSVELEPGDLISIGKYIRHWCEVCPDTRFRAIRFISHPESQDTVYTRSGIEAEYEPFYVSPASFAHAGLRSR
jgi:1,2-dihydroxy-3-keto-5-methylthiopentene dioxygenase